jgi:Tfp pilus assembly protein PilV
MLRTISFRNSGISLVEVMIAMVLTAIAIISVFPMQNASTTSAGRSDFVGRAAGIMLAELEEREHLIMSVNTTATPPVTVPLATVNKQVTVSDLGVEGDVTFNVVTTTRVNPAAPTSSWIVNVTVTWVGRINGSTSSSIIVTNQAAFRPPTSGTVG